MKQLLTNLLTAAIMVGLAMVCIVAMVPFAFAISFINTIQQGNNE